MAHSIDILTTMIIILSKSPASSSLIKGANASGLLVDYSADALLVALPTELMAHNIELNRN